MNKPKVSIEMRPVSCRFIIFADSSSSGFRFRFLIVDVDVLTFVDASVSSSELATIDIGEKSTKLDCPRVSIKFEVGEMSNTEFNN